MKPIVLTDYEVLLAAACLTNAKRLLLEKMPFAPAGIDMRARIDDIAERIRIGTALTPHDIETVCACIENVRRMARKDYNIPVTERAKLQRGCEKLIEKLNGALPNIGSNHVRQDNASAIISDALPSERQESNSAGPDERPGLGSGLSDNG
jgi:hypothetical protein